MKNFGLQDDIKAAKEIMKNGKNYILNKGFEEHDQIYPYNNEYIKLYYDYFDYSKGILSVASSGDHMLHAILEGANDILLFDINKLTSYYCALKLAGVKALSHNEFFDFFGRKDNAAPNFYKKELYEKVREYLNEDDKCFWDSLYTSGLSNNISSINLCNLVSSPNHNAFYDKELYTKLKENAKDIERPEFIHCDVLELPMHLENKMFSTMFLSNIYGYMKGKKCKQFQELIYTDLDEHLTKDGMIAYANFPSNNTMLSLHEKKCGISYAYKK